MEQPTASVLDKLVTAPQYVLPHHLLSRLMHGLTRLPLGKALPPLLRAFVKHYQIDLTEVAEPDLQQYRHFNAFFTRALKSEARPLAQAAVLSPVDGTISQIGKIRGQTLLQAKGHDYTLHTLLGGYDALAKLFQNGHFCTLYLSPRDYHRIHMPLAGQPLDMVYVPGRLFSVNARTVRSVPGVFARNERVVCLFKTALGPMALVMVGALFVGSIDTIWEERVAPNAQRKIQRWQVPDNLGTLAQGAEVARFNMGSTVILLLGDHQQLNWLAGCQPGTAVKMGQALA